MYCTIKFKYKQHIQNTIHNGNSFKRKTKTVIKCTHEHVKLLHVPKYSTIKTFFKDNNAYKKNS